MKIVQPIRDHEKIDQLKTVLRHQSYRNYFLFVFAINSGLRISDILPLKVLDVKDKDHISLIEKKTDKTKRFLINPILKAEIDEYITGMDLNDYLFPSRTEQKNKPISRVMAYIILNTAAKQIGLDEFRCHSTRKTFGYFFIRNIKMWPCYKEYSIIRRRL
jgi:integrase